MEFLPIALGILVLVLLLPLVQEQIRTWRGGA